MHAFRIVSTRRLKACFASWIESADLPPDCLGSVTLHPHQRQAVRLLDPMLRRYGGALLADDVGLGKTFSALATCRQAKHVLVVAPATLRAMWLEAAIRAGRHIDFRSYQSLSGGRLATGPWDYVIADEAHHLRNPRTKRYEALAHLVTGVPLLVLTATPIHNRDRELRHLFALFLGAQALRAGDSLLRACTVRRTHRDVGSTVRLPSVQPLEWIPLPRNDRVVEALSALPPSVPPLDGGAAPALVSLLLLRLWSSSDAALRAALRRLLGRALALTAALQDGRQLRRSDVRAWAVAGDTLQLAWAGIIAPEAPAPVDTAHLLDTLEQHIAGLRRVLAVLADGPDVDAARTQHLAHIATNDDGVGAIAFTQFRETARALFSRLRTSPGVAWLSARAAGIASGSISRHELLRLAGPARATADPRLSPRLLMTTDVLSEGVNLSGLGQLVHIDLPWTPARARQRLGRLLRPDSLHPAVRVHAFELPADAEAFVGLLRRLQEKAAASGRWLTSELVHGVPWVHPPASPVFETESAIRARIAAWHDGPPPPEGLPLVASCTSDSARDWCALACARIGDQMQLAVVDRWGWDDSAHTVHAVVCAAGSGRRTSNISVNEMWPRLEAWWSALCGAVAVAPDTPARARVHERAHRLLARAESALNRKDRVAAAPRLAGARSAIDGATGAGAERALALLVNRWQKVRFGSDEGLDAITAIAKMTTELGDGGGKSSVSHDDALLGVLFVVPNAPLG